MFKLYDRQSIKDLYEEFLNDPLFLEEVRAMIRAHLVADLATFHKALADQDHKDRSIVPSSHPPSI